MIFDDLTSHCLHQHRCCLVEACISAVLKTRLHAVKARPCLMSTLVIQDQASTGAGRKPEMTLDTQAEHTRFMFPPSPRLSCEVKSQCDASPSPPVLQRCIELRPQLLVLLLDLINVLLLHTCDMGRSESQPQVRALVLTFMIPYTV